jgi:flagellin
MTLTNIAAMNAIANNNQNGLSMNSSLERLNTGLRINKASDDSSGLSIADKLRTQASSLSQSISNGNSAVALLQIADGAMEEISDSLDSIKSKLIQASSDTTSDEGRENIRKDIAKLLKQIDNIAKDTNYNGVQLLANADNSATSALTFQMGEKATSTISTDGAVRANSEGLTLDSLRDLATNGLDKATAQAGITSLDTAVSTLNNWRGDFGSTQNQIESSIRNMLTTETNIIAAESVIRDVDYEKESANFSKLQIMSQAGMYALTQSNVVQQNVLRLLQ